MTEREAIKCCKGMIQRLERPAFMVQHEGAINDIMALDMAISALKKLEQDRWIPCKERLPEYKEKVLVSYDTEDGKKVDISMFDKYGCLLGIVDAWRPLPEPYTEEES